MEKIKFSQPFVPLRSLTLMIDLLSLLNYKFYNNFTKIKPAIFLFYFSSLS